RRQNPAAIAGPGTIVVNWGQAGYYHTLYTPPLVQDLADHFGQLDAADQLGLLYDSAALGLAGYQPLSDMLHFGEKAKAAADPLVTTGLADQLAGLASFYRGLPGQAAYQSFARALLQPAL